MEVDIDVTLIYLTYMSFYDDKLSQSRTFLKNIVKIMIELYMFEPRGYTYVS